MLEQLTLVLAQDGPAPAPVTPQDLTGQPSELQPSTPMARRTESGTRKDPIAENILAPSPRRRQRTGEDP